MLKFVRGGKKVGLAGCHPTQLILTFQFRAFKSDIIGRTEHHRIAEISVGKTWGWLRLKLVNMVRKWFNLVTSWLVAYILEQIFATLSQNKPFFRKFQLNMRSNRGRGQLRSPIIPNLYCRIVFWIQIVCTWGNKQRDPTREALSGGTVGNHSNSIMF